MKNGMVFSSSRGRDRLLLRGSWSHWLQCLQSTKVFQRLILRSHLVVIRGWYFTVDKLYRYGWRRWDTNSLFRCWGINCSMNSLYVMNIYIYMFWLSQIKSKKWKLDDISFPPFREKSVDASVRYINIFSFFCCEKMRISIFSFYHFTYIL